MEAAPRVSIIILNWNGWKDTTECLDSICLNEYPFYDIIVIDNGSDNESLRQIAHYCECRKFESLEESSFLDEGRVLRTFGYAICDNSCLDLDVQINRKRLIVIDNGINSGFPEGNNIGIRYAIKYLNPDFFFLLNNDTIVDKGFLTALIDNVPYDPHIAGFGPKIYLFSDPNRLQAIGVRIKSNIFSRVGIKLVKVSDFRFIGYFEEDNGQYDTVERVDSLIGCGMLINANMIQKVGFLEKDFFLYHEESDWLYRMYQNGYYFLYIPTSKIWHKYSASSGGELSPLVVYYSTRNSILFAKRHNSCLIYYLYIIYLFTYVHARKLIKFTLIHRDFSLLLKFYSGVADGIKQERGLSR